MTLEKRVEKLERARAKASEVQPTARLVLYDADNPPTDEELEAQYPGVRVYLLPVKDDDSDRPPPPLWHEDER